MHQFQQQEVGGLLRGTERQQQVVHENRQTIVASLRLSRLLRLHERPEGRRLKRDALDGSIPGNPERSGEDQLRDLDDHLDHVMDVFRRNAAKDIEERAENRAAVSRDDDIGKLRQPEMKEVADAALIMKQPRESNLTLPGPGVQCVEKRRKKILPHGKNPCDLGIGRGVEREKVGPQLFADGLRNRERLLVAGLQ